MPTAKSSAKKSTSSPAASAESSRPEISLDEIKSAKVRSTLDSLCRRHMNLSRQEAVVSFAKFLAKLDDDARDETFERLRDLVDTSSPEEIGELAKGLAESKKEAASEIASLIESNQLGEKVRADDWVAFETKGRATISSTLLLQRAAGMVNPDTGEEFGIHVIEDSTKRGASYWQVRPGAETED